MFTLCLRFHIWRVKCRYFVPGGACKHVNSTRREWLVSRDGQFVVDHSEYLFLTDICFTKDLLVLRHFITHKSILTIEYHSDAHLSPYRKNKVRVLIVINYERISSITVENRKSKIALVMEFGTSNKCCILIKYLVACLQTISEISNLAPKSRNL